MGFISRPRLGGLTQGTIFSCARAEGYTTCPVHGLVITARCDIAQEKVPLYNYLPVVPLRAWLEHDGRILLCARAGKECRNRLVNCLDSAGYSETVLDTIPLAEIEKSLFPEDSKERKIVNGRKQFIAASEKFNLVHEAAGNAGLSSTKAVSDAFPSIRSGLLKDLINQRLTGYYFLPSVEHKGKEEGHVVLLREIRHLPSALATLIAAGTELAEVQNAKTEPYEHAGCMDFAIDDFSCPVGQIDSPHIEHVMQVFSTLFARIGLPDPKADLHNDLWAQVEKELPK